MRATSMNATQEALADVREYMTRNAMPKLSRQQLIDGLGRLDRQRRDLAENFPRDGVEIRRIKLQMRDIERELSKFKTDNWREEPGQFCRAFKLMAKRHLELEAYEMLVQETVRWLKHRHSPMSADLP
jgi:hypothetical protein